jgi:hypothetical protein
MMPMMKETINSNMERKRKGNERKENKTNDGERKKKKTPKE